MNSLTVLLLCTLAACVVSQEVISETCLLSKRGPNGKEIKYDINILSKLQNRVKSKKITENWVAEEFNALTEDGKDRDDFFYYINICVPLVNNQESGVPNGVGVYQVVADRPDNSHVAGTISGAKLASLRDGDLRYKFGPGDISKTSCNLSDINSCPKRSAEIILFCSDVGYGEPEFADEVNHLEYLFVWNMCAACPVGSLLREKCDVDPIDECRFIGGNSSLSTGTILFITALTLFLTYLTLGTLYNRFFLGARGIEQLPNHELWMSLCGKIGDGVAFVLQCGRPSNAKENTSVSYEKVTMDIEEDSSEGEDLEANKTTASGYN